MNVYNTSLNSLLAGDAETAGTEEVGVRYAVAGGVVAESGGSDASALALGIGHLYDKFLAGPELRVEFDRHLVERRVGQSI